MLAYAQFDFFRGKLVHSSPRKSSNLHEISNTQGTRALFVPVSQIEGVRPLTLDCVLTRSSAVSVRGRLAMHTLVAVENVRAHCGLRITYRSGIRCRYHKRMVAKIIHLRSAPQRCCAFLRVNSPSNSLDHLAWFVETTAVETRNVPVLRSFWVCKSKVSISHCWSRAHETLELLHTQRDRQG